MANYLHEEDSQANSLYAALARTVTRSAALYFSRPVRLFRPSKVSGWHSLRGIAAKDGQKLSPTYLYSLVKQDGFMVIPKHFVPPIIVNALLGTVLWSTYAEASDFYKNYVTWHGSVAALSGATAGAAQAIVAAPAENLRIVLEGGTHTWTEAWKEVFRSTAPDPRASKEQNRQEVRAVREWVRDVREMAGYGWHGWGWGLAKDVCGFAIFFTIFDYSRRIASSLKAYSRLRFQPSDKDPKQGNSLRRYIPSLVNGLTLVSGGAFAGLSYEMICRPFDAARKVVHHYHIEHPRHPRPPFTLKPLIDKVKEEGLISYFRDPHAFHDLAPSHAHISMASRRVHHLLRTLARVGPWGIGFLVWETFASDTL